MLASAKRFLKNPNTVLIEEASIVLSENASAAPEVLNGVLKNAAKDAELLAELGNAEKSIGEGVANLLKEPELATKLRQGVIDEIQFTNQNSYINHFEKHHSEMSQIFEKGSYTMEKYLNDANHVIREGKFLPEKNAYVKFIGKATNKKIIDLEENLSKNIKYAFVGLDRKTGKITTFHFKKVSELIKDAPSLGFELKRFKTK